MHLLLFSMIAICIAGSRSQEIAIATEYLRAHANDSLSSESAMNAQVQDHNPPPIHEEVDVHHVIPLVIETTTAAPKDAADDKSPEKADDKTKAFDHEHKTHHEHDATITVDVHNILDLFKQQLQETEQRILDAVKSQQQQNSLSPASIVGKSYRTADR